MIRLEGGFERDQYWQEVRRTGDDRLKESGFEDWVVTVRPRAGAQEEEVAVKMSVATRMLDIAIRGQPELPPESFVQTNIIDVIDQAIDTRSDDNVEDMLRDEGGEA